MNSVQNLLYNEGYSIACYTFQPKGGTRIPTKSPASMVINRNCVLMYAAVAVLGDQASRNKGLDILVHVETNSE